MFLTILGKTIGMIKLDGVIKQTIIILYTSHENDATRVKLHIIWLILWFSIFALITLV